MEFVDANRMPDGSVKPTHESLKGRRPAHKVAPPPGPHEARLTAAKDHADAAEPIETYTMCSRYGFIPNHLQLEAGVPYLFKIMAMDVPHGISINFRTASLMMRAPVKMMIEKTLVFTEPGEFLTYCSTYCGAYHHIMKGKIVVA
jgi:heme/copper-type cytochrome/quinol oxidase subunit 2